MISVLLLKRLEEHGINVTFSECYLKGMVGIWWREKLGTTIFTLLRWSCAITNKEIFGSIRSVLFGWIYNHLGFLSLSILYFLSLYELKAYKTCHQ